MNIQKQTWTIISNDLESNSNLLTIKNDEHHYAFHVLRIKEGDKIEITNCQGLKAEGMVTFANKKELSIEIQKVHSYQKSKPEINLWLAMPKPTTLDEVIANSSEMGASHIHIFKSEKAASKAPLKIEKAKHLSDEATRISKSPFASRISYYDSLETFYNQHILASTSKKLVLFCDECHVYEGKIKNSIFKEIQSHFKKEMDEICILIGPEASFSNQEREFIQKNLNCIPVSLGSNILRVPNATASALGVAINFRNDFV
jgi:16S rRNA (uracil1498-N3)-methyltransferase